MPPHLASADRLSDRARRALALGTYADLTPRAAGPADARDLLDALAPADVLAAPPASPGDARLALAALWLWNDFLDEAHALCQSVASPLGGYWHGVVHRREGDVANAGYWFRRAGPLACFASLSAKANDLLRDAPPDKRLFRVNARGWDSAAFADLCGTLDADDPVAPHAVALQKLEWATVFDATVNATRL